MTTTPPAGRRPRGARPRHGRKSLATLAVLVGCQTASTDANPHLTYWRPHVGPVTSVVATPHGFASCSQAGVAWPGADVARPGAGVTRPGAGVDAGVEPTPFRTFALAALDDDTLVAAGGAPDRSGEVAVLQAHAVRARRLVGNDVCYAVAVAPDRTRLALGCADGRLLLLALPDLADAGMQKAHTAACRAVAFAPDGSLVASAGLDGVVRLQDLATGSARRLVDHTAGVECLAIDAGGTRIASGARDGKVRVHARDGRLRRTFLRLGAEVLALVWLDARTLVAGTSNGRVLVLSDEGDGEVREVARVEGAVHALACDGDEVAVGSTGGVTLLASVLASLRR